MLVTDYATEVPNNVTDVVHGEFAFDYGSGQVTGASGGKRVLDPEIASEGVKVLLSDGRQAPRGTGDIKLKMPDLSQIEALKHYFEYGGYQFFPIWLYHPTLPAVVARDAQDAGENYGVELKKSTDDERAAFGAGEWRWVFHGEWRTTPYDKTKPTEAAAMAGKHMVLPVKEPTLAAVNELAKALRTDRGGGADVGEVDPGLIEEFKVFLAWKASQV